MSDTSSRTRWLIGGTVGLVIVGGGLAWLSRGYGEVSQPGYQYAMALVSACNRQDAPRVEQIVAGIEEAVDAHELPTYDAQVLLRICRRALAGDWQWSSREVRRLMIDQIR